MISIDPVQSRSGGRPALFASRLRAASGCLVVAGVATAIALWSMPLNAAPQESQPIWRAQLELRIGSASETSTVPAPMTQFGNVDGAGTDDAVQARLNNASVTRLDYGRDDFERNSRFTYDLVLDNLRSFADLGRLEISKTGSDGLCLKGVTLIVNGRAIFRQDLPPSPGKSCRWLDNSGGHTRSVVVNGQALRSSPEWQAFVQPLPPFLISRAELESRVEAIVGHQNAAPGNKLKWGHLHGRAVEISRKNDTTVHVDLDLTADINNLPDPEVDVDFDLRFSCSNGVVSVQTQSPKVSVDSSWVYELISLGLIEFLDNKAEQAIQRGFRSMPFGTQVETGQSRCPGITVTNDGSIVFQLIS